MEVSVVSIAKKENELAPLKKILKKQTFKDFEFVYSTKKGIPHAWNDAISRAKGKIIVITESDATPLTNTWLEEMINEVKKNNKKTIIRGIEVAPQPFCFCNLACYASILKNNRLDESFPLSEDAELFSRLKKMGYKGIEVPIAPVLHKRSKTPRELIRNEFLRGMLNTKIYLRYGYVSFKDSARSSSGIIKREIGIVLSRVAFLFGILVGFVKEKLRIDR